MIPVSLKQVAGALGVGERPEYADIVVRRVATDSRAVEPGDLFWAVRGARFDGNEFVDQAAAKGAAACVCSSAVDLRSSALDRRACLRVDDSVAALGRFAAYYRQEIMPRSTAVVAITGSNGKTTTKSMIDCVLAPSYPGRSAPKSFNNSIGVPLTLLSGEADDRYLIMEIGTNSRGEVAALAAIGSPDVAVITSIGEAHLEGLGDVRAVAAEKTSLLDYLRPQALAVVNTDRPEVRPLLRRGVSMRLLTFGCHPRAELRISEVDATIRGTRFLLGGKYRVELTMPGAHHTANAAAAFAVGRWFGLDPAEIVDRLRAFRPAEGRTQLAEVDG
ncbi:MAG: UDP-N-acetylmuramoyl-tripeptide--D-alanyl-D-alanine ligase, partial [Planctomycetes bacterium]|nr:UDP-N-acetylmuramoyl-tripeptide--D-alanyl-D-alanine ligase [Planctomycetota bacterium]